MNAHVEHEGCQDSVGPVDMDQWTGKGNAEPTSRVLDGSRDHGWDQEWVEPGTYAGQPATLVYLLMDADLCGADGGPYDDPSNVDWMDHIARIVLLAQ